MSCSYGDDDQNPHSHCYLCDNCQEPICGGHCTEKASGPHGCRCTQDAYHLYFCLYCQKAHADSHGLSHSIVFPDCAGLVSERALEAASEQYLQTAALGDTAPAITSANVFLNAVAPGHAALLKAVRGVDDIPYSVSYRSSRPTVQLHAKFFESSTAVRLALLAAHNLGLAFLAGFRFNTVKWLPVADQLLRDAAAAEFAEWTRTGERPSDQVISGWIRSVFGQPISDRDRRRQRNVTEWLNSVFLESLRDPVDLADWFVGSEVPAT